MYAGESIFDEISHGEGSVALNESPVNLFKIDFELFPKVHFVERIYTEFLAAGDCIYVPAFYWY